MMQQPTSYTGYQQRCYNAGFKLTVVDRPDRQAKFIQLQLGESALWPRALRWHS